MSQNLIDELSTLPALEDSIMEDFGADLLGNLKKQILSMEKLLQNLVDQRPIEEYHVNSIEMTFHLLQKDWYRLKTSKIEGAYL